MSRPIAAETPATRCAPHLVVRLIVLLGVMIGLTGCRTAPPPVSLTEEERMTRPEFSPGDPAPPLAVSEWVKGTAVTSFEPGMVYIIDFWAVWCAPCIAAMPRISQLQDAHPDRVVAIALTTVDDVNSPAAIRRFVRERDAHMRFRVAIDDGSTTADAYRRAARETAIPRTFVINGDGVLAWIGHPKDVDPVVERILAGAWDVNEAAAARDEAIRQQLEARRLWEMEEQAREAGDQAARLNALAALCALDVANIQISPPHWPFAAHVYALGVAGRVAEASASATAALERDEFREDAWAHASMAEAVLPADPDLADRIASRTLELIAEQESAPAPTDSWDAYMFHGRQQDRAQARIELARLRAKQNRYAEAVTLQERAIAQLEGRGFQSIVDDLKRQLEDYRQKAGE